MPLNQEAMVRAVQLDSKISKGLYTHLGENVNMLKKRIAAEVSRGISTGMTYAQVAKQISGKMMGTYENPGGSMAYSMRIARTEGHRIQTTAAMDAMESAKEKGADVVKQWDAALDSRTRESHQAVDGEIRELHEKFSNGLMYPGDPSGGAAEVVNCRCALLQRAKWALDEDELETLKQRAEYFGLDKTTSFEDFKQKYIDALKAQPIKPKKEYLTEKKLKQYIDDGNVQLETLKQEFADELEYDSYDAFFKDYKNLNDAINQAMLFGSPDEVVKLHQQVKKAKIVQTKIDDLSGQIDEWQEKLDKKLTAKEIKKLKKEEILLQDQFDNFNVKTYSNIWKDDVTTADWSAKQGSVQAKKQYFEGKLQSATDPDDVKKWQGLLDDLDDFDKQGASYYDIKSKLTKTKADLTKLQKSGKITPQNADAFTQERKDNAYWFTNQNGSTAGADGVLRDKCGEVWRSATKDEKDSIYEYTQSYSKYNEPLRGIEYGTNKYLGVGNVDLETIGTNYGGYKRGQVKKLIDDMTSIIEKSSYDFDIWVQRGCRYGGMDKFFGIDPNDFNLPEADLAAKLLGTTPTEYAFLSTGVSKGKGFSSHPIIMNIYAPKGTKMMYAEPFSAFGHGSGRKWDGVSKQGSFGNEAEMIFQRGTKFRVTKVEKSGGKIWVDMEVIEQGVS